MAEEESLSWHKIIYFEMRKTKQTETRETTGSTGWKITANGLPEFENKLEENLTRRENQGKEIDAEQLTIGVKEACDHAFRRKTGNKGKRKAVYWWTTEVGEERRLCI